VLVTRNRHRNRGSARNTHHRVTKVTKDLLFIDPQLTINYQRILDLEPSNLRTFEPSRTFEQSDHDYEHDDDYEHEI